jgi:uncharacterized protein YaiI (UPF0178 family)
MKTLLTAAFAILSMAIFAQTAPFIHKQESLGGRQDDGASSIEQTTNRGYIVAGYSFSNTGDVSGHHAGSPNADYWIVKLTKNGDIRWQKCLGGSGSDDASSIQQTTDSGYIVAGSSTSNNGDVRGNHGGADYWIVKLKINGDIQWQKSLGGSSNDNASSIQQTTDSGYIVAGTSYSNDGDVSGHHGGSLNADYWIVKLTKNGDIQWQKSFGGSGNDNASSIQQTTDSGYIVAGTSYSNNDNVRGNHGGADYWIVKLTKNGDIQWQKSLGGSSNDNASSIQQTTDSGYIVAGSSTSNNGDVSGHHGGSLNADYWIVKLTKNGDIQWQKSLGGSSNDNASSIQQTTDSGYIVAGTSYSNNDDVRGNHGGADYWIVKLTKNGDIQWQKSLGGSGTDYANSIQQTADSGYVVAGSSTSNDGHVSRNHGGYDYWIVKLSKDSLAVAPVITNIYTANQNAVQAAKSSKDFMVYPNPAKDVLNVQTKGDAVFSVLSAKGEILFTRTLNSNGSINTSALQSGTYYLKNNITGIVKKFIVAR